MTDDVGVPQVGAPSVAVSIQTPVPVQRPVRVLRLITRLNVGGPTRHVALLTRGLRAHGFETLLAAGATAESEASMEWALREQGVRALAIAGLILTGVHYGARNPDAWYSNLVRWIATLDKDERL